MASRSVWSGALTLGPMLTLHLEATKATEKYAGSQPLKEVCACHLQPFEREIKCAVTGQLRVAAGGGGAYMVKAVEKPDGTFARVDDSAITAGMSKEIVPLAIIPSADVPEYAINEFWRLRPSKKVPGAEQAVAYVLAWLRARDVAVIVRFPYTGHQHIGALVEVEGTLAMERLRYTQELREPEPEHLAPGKIEVPDRALALIDEVVLDLPTNFSHAAVEDASVSERAALIARIIGGKAPEAPTPEAAPEQTAPDLMAALEGAMANRPKAKTATPASKAKVKA